ncbi:MAG: transcriptional regulator [Alphaproteobacteria bacterium RIFCSPLOWO2_01_FULL_40_26]|nr:MAG: transcriptional regulator [Alphaproteobacteria bacterium RIFCSPHIGHO2_02_FULL_40_34]OFW88463.1 MAG: transcriptional regulator [Alphaproteobacteria bacterium RIFCSPHIGHO2_01_FULL_40_8]OFW94839.1 MAG: transcriptional regulator [Alphaproteobacteria bacterium RIFCSPLOWO2_01_FULL_40_26]OFX10465.1 MAG: transcriptional regulator [Alphaproteobacteria bacterium RIFCSPLOWO2_02_FULL_40_19]OFX11039.1 MAG: transcriptional regulator [Alphaproteobacteria bacterium RIFCSPLOWO2_12_FULL_40_11]
MPEISRFLGIVIKMYFQDHNPPHFHVEYGQYTASINMEDFAIIKGNLPPRIHGLITEWASLHKNELLDNWNKAKELKNLKSIKPLV